MVIYGMCSTEPSSLNILFLMLICSSRETYASLFEVMHTTNSVMRIYFDGVDAVELLIYTSKQLRLDLLGKPFLVEKL